ncbi:ATP-grasp domain-containing protein [Nocardia seriolae]|uniref:ATP-grasp domain-containing protein n=1 Tax=Nocardia seriolae TaxID=37332 RepID=UPI000D129CE6|nr:hypothetical protein [Nocardia seriolae]PSK27634.1 hypothetical protein C6575_30885 [Nocardia seriolae]QUN16281.1 hypothetical protein KEC46_29090 [Nocardia seriolae]
MNEARLPLLLRASPFRVRARRSSLDFQFRVGHPSAREPDGSAPCVTVLSRAADRELDRLSLSLAAKGIPMVRMDSDRCAGIDCRWDLETGILHWDSRAFHPIVVWRRYFAMEAVALPVGELAHYGREQWAAWAMMLCGSRTHRINAAAEPGRPDRLAQLDAARRAGLRTPATAVGTRTADAAALIPGRADLIVKSLGAHAVEPEPGRLRGIFPRRVTRAELSAECAVEPAPVIVQEFLTAAAELRIYLVGQRLIGYRVTRPSPEAIWTEPESIRVRRWAVPPPLATALSALGDEFRLDIAAFDLLDTADGPVFLEVNPECDWMWAEHGAGAPEVSAAVHDLVAERFAKQQGRERV